MFSRTFNEIETLQNMFGPEAAAASLANLKQNTEKTILSSRMLNEAITKGEVDPQEIDSSLSPNEQLEDVNKSVTTLNFEENSLKKASGKRSTRAQIAKLVGVSEGSCVKYLKIGKMVKKGDHIAITAVKNYDNDIWSLDQAYIITEIRNYERTESCGFITTHSMIEKIENATLEDAKKTATDVIKEWKKIKVPTTPGEKYDILFTGAVYDPKKYRKKLLPMHPNTILFWLSQSTNVKESISLIQKWGFNYQDCIPVYVGEDNSCQWSKYKYNLLLVCTRDHFVQDETMRFPEIMNSIDDVRRGIEKMFPTQTKYELFRSDQLPGWGIPDKEEDEDEGTPSPASQSRW
jgi:hypothetical protein